MTTILVPFHANERLPDGDIPIDADVTVQPEPDEYFHQELVRSLFERAVQDLREECVANGRQIQFVLFERYDLNPEEGVSYAQLARELGLTAAQVTNHLAHARRRFRERALEALRGLCGSHEEFRREAYDIFGVNVA